MSVIIKQGNPIILTEADRTKYQPVIEAATLNELDEVSLNADNLTMYGNGTRKTLKYPAGADVRWVVEQVRKFAEVARKAFKAQDATSKRFVQLCAEVLSKGGDVTISYRADRRYPQQTYPFVYLYLEKEDGHTFEAECETSILGAAMDDIARLRMEEMRRRKEAAEEKAKQREANRLRELARKHNVK